MSDFALHGVSVVDFGAVGDGLYDCTGPVQRAFDEAAGDGGGGVVFFPPGVWRCGSLCLRSGITIVLRKGAVLQAAREAEKFPHFTHSVDSRMDLFPWRAFLFGVGLSDLCIRGEGMIECGGESPAFQDGVGDSPDRPYGLFLVDCQNVRLEGLRLRNSAHWMMRLLQCRDVRLQGLSIFNHCNRNNDGMDIDSCDGVVVSDCIIDSSDDALCLKSETTQACRNVLIRNCLLSSHASAIKFGTASIGGFINVVVSDCIIRPSRATTMHHPFDLPNGMTGIDIACVDGGEVHSLSFQQIFMEGVLNPIYIKLGQRYSMGTIPKNRNASEAKVVLSPQGKGSIKGVYFRGIHVREAGPVASMVFGSPEHEIEQLVFRDVHVQCRPLSDGRSSNPPDWSPNGYPCAVSTAGKDGTLVCGFHFRHVWDLLLDNVKVEPGAGDGRELIECVDVEGFRQANAFC